MLVNLLKKFAEAYPKMGVTDNSNLMRRVRKKVKLFQADGRAA